MERTWHEQTLYPKDEHEMKAVFAALMERGGILITTLLGADGKVHSQQRKAKNLTDHVEACARMVDVLLMRA